MAEFFPGNWCDVVAHPDGYAFVRQDGKTIICEVSGVEAWRVELDEPLLYLRAACSPVGAVAAIGQGNHTGTALFIGRHGWLPMGPTFGQNCTIIVWDDDQFVAYIQRTGSTYTRWPLNEPEPPAQQIPIGPTSQGWLDVRDGEMIWTDPNRTLIVEGYTLHLPMTRGGVTVGQGAVSPDQITAVLPNGQASTVIEAASWEPHIAALIDGRYAICARTPLGAALALCPPWPAYVHRSQPPAPIPPPAPPQTPLPLAITLTEYTETGTAPLTVTADYEVYGHRGPVEVMLTVAGQIVVGSDAPSGTLTTIIEQPGEYRLGAIVTSVGRTAQTGAIRIVRVLPVTQPVPVPPLPVTGRDAFTLAADEARKGMQR